MITVHVIYDPLVFYTEEEYQQLHPEDDTKIQSVIEQPSIHFLACGSSSGEDQAALIGDRLSCLDDLSRPVKLKRE